MIQFSVAGNPVGKARARTFFNEKGEHVVTTTPDKTVLYQNLVKVIALESMKNNNIELTEEPVSMEIKAYYQIPKSATKKLKALMAENKLLPCKKPDIDNVIKIIADSLNGIAYKDDTQIVKLTAHKLYSDNPRVEIKLNIVQA
jgi:Holliday junction resolvase RusA-like endonuclease